MALTYLIAASDVVTKFTYLNTDEALIKNDHIFTAQYDHVKPKIGDDWYDELITEKATSFSAANQTIYDNYLKDALSWFALAEAVPNIIYQSGNQGVFEHSPEFNLPTGRKGMQQITDYAMSMGDSLIAAMIDYVKDNLSSYPLYTASKQAELSRLGGLLLG